MTARAGTFDARLGEVGKRFSLTPAEGWLTLVATALMVAVFATSIVDAAWTPSSAGSSGFLLWIGLGGFLFGVIGAKVGWGRWRTHIVGGLIAGLLIPLIAGGLALGRDTGWDPMGLAQRLAAAYDVSWHVWDDLVTHSRPWTNQLAHYHMIFGGLVWGAGALAGFTVFGHRRPLDAVVVLGLAILANMALTRNDQLFLLVLFTTGALLLLIRTHVFEEEVTWTRRKIGDPSVVGQLYVKGGAAFVTVAVLGSILLTATASSAPLQGLWQDLPRHLQDLSSLLQRIAPPGGKPRTPGIVGFDKNTTTSGIWEPSNAVAFRAQFPAGEEESFKWRAGTYSEYTLYGWNTGAESRVDAAPQDVLFADNAYLDAPTQAGHRLLSIQVFPEAFVYPTVLAPNMVRTIDQPSQQVRIGEEGWFATLESPNATGNYAVSALVPVFSDGPGGITEARLRAASTDYPPELLEIYTALPADALGPAASALLGDIIAAVPAAPDGSPGSAYDVARTMESYLASTRFTYNPDVRELRRNNCGSASTAECFAIIKQGYCEFYATTMAVLLRAAGVPARIAYGFLSAGERSPDGIEIVGGSAQHQWVEVYFPGTGWVEFDPTGGGVGAPQPIPSGSLDPSTAPPSAVVPTSGASLPFPTGGATDPGGPPTTGAGPFIAIALILLVGVVALAFAALRRGSRKPMHPDQAWGSVARLAGRFGLGPRPSQTVYEYAGMLGDSVPTARVELTTIARAKVEVAYGRRDLGTDRLKRIAEAYHRLRLAVLGFVLRRSMRGVRDIRRRK